MFGVRATALRTASVADFKPDVVGPDGIRRDVLEIRPGKTWDPDEVHPLPLPTQVGQWIREWIRITGREIGDDSPLFPGKKPKPGLKLEPLSSVAFYAAIAGTKEGARALIPLDGDPYVGYRQHGLRHTAQQLIQRAAVELKAENPGALDHLTPDDFSRAVLGHALTRTTPDVYRDLDRAKLTHLVVDKAWAILWGEGTTRTGLDPWAIKQTREHVESIRVVIRASEGEIRRMTRRQQDLGVRARTLNGDRLTQALIESNATAAQLEEYAQQLAALRASLTDAEKASERARTRPVALPHDLSDEDHTRLLAEALDEETRTSEAPDGPLADYLTVSDLTEIWDATDQTINRWARGRFPNCGPAPWDNDAWIVDGPRRKRLPVDALEQALLTEAQRRRLHEVRHQRALLDSDLA